MCDLKNETGKPLINENDLGFKCSLLEVVV